MLMIIMKIHRREDMISASLAAYNLPTNGHVSAAVKVLLNFDVMFTLNPYDDKILIIEPVGKCTL